MILERIKLPLRLAAIAIHLALVALQMLGAIVFGLWYQRGLGRKQRTAIRVKGESRKPTANSVIYG